MASAFHVEFLAGVVPALFAEFGRTATHIDATGATQTAVTVVVQEQSATVESDDHETRDVRRATVWVRRSEIVPAVEDAFSVVLDAYTGATTNWVVVQHPVFEAGVARCECESVVTRNVNRQRVR